MSHREGIEIDYCPQCRGVWLDRGELDKIIERSAAEVSRPYSDDQRHRSGDQHYKQRKPKHILKEIFDF